MDTSQKCSQCKTNLKEEDVFCSNCGFPERADDSEKSKYAYRIQLKMNVLKDAKKKLKNVKILLYVIIGINLILGIFFLTNDFTFYEGIGSLISAVIYLGCVIWVDKQPLIGIMAAFIFWILIQLSVIFTDPSLLFNGIILKVIFIAIFIKGITSAKDYLNYSAQLKEMKAA